MPVKKPSAKATKAKKTVSAKPRAKAPAKAAAQPARKAKASPKKATARTPAKVTVPKVKVQVAPKARPATAATAKPATALKPAAQVARPSATPATLPTTASLLAGPRNVEPYVPRKGEEYMSKEQLEHFRGILSDWKQDLMQEVDRTMLHMKDEAANFPDPNDRATQESEFSLELRTRDRERKLIRKIDEALKRIEDGTYGFCLETGEPIGVKRLEARPVATLSVEAQERRERREKQFGDRDDWYR